MDRLQGTPPFDPLDLNSFSDCLQRTPSRRTPPGEPFQRTTSRGQPPMYPVQGTTSWGSSPGVSLQRTPSKGLLQWIHAETPARDTSTGYRKGTHFRGHSRGGFLHGTHPRDHLQGNLCMEHPPGHPIHWLLMRGPSTGDLLQWTPPWDPLQVTPSSGSLLGVPFKRKPSKERLPEDPLLRTHS